ncbi:MAG: DUF6169 family protein [Spirosomaceae bacterium]|nr:DUF6169 family protein [Spirosomataceae bacterium]
MSNEERQSLAYDFFFFGGENNSYGFQTSNYISYEIKFKPMFYLFEPHKEYANSAYEFVIEVFENTTNKTPSYDDLMPVTIATIIEDFYNKINQPLIIYVCDSSDGRQLARNRKIEVILLDKSGERVPTVMILRNNNPYFSEIISDFQKILIGYNDDDK